MIFFQTGGEKMCDLTDKEKLNTIQKIITGECSKKKQARY